MRFIVRLGKRTLCNQNKITFDKHSVGIGPLFLDTGGGCKEPKKKPPYGSNSGSSGKTFCCVHTCVLCCTCLYLVDKLEHCGVGLRCGDSQVLGTRNGCVHVLDFNGYEIKKYALHSDAVNDVSVDSSGDYIASCSDDGISFACCSVLLVHFFCHDSILAATKLMCKPPTVPAFIRQLRHWQWTFHHILSPTHQTFVQACTKRAKSGKRVSTFFTGSGLLKSSSVFLRFQLVFSSFYAPVGFRTIPPCSPGHHVQHSLLTRTSRTTLHLLPFKTARAGFLGCWSPTS